MVWKKQADSAWKVLFDMSNSDLPLAPNLPPAHGYARTLAADLRSAHKKPSDERREFLLAAAVEELHVAVLVPADAFADDVSAATVRTSSGGSGLVERGVLMVRVILRPMDISEHIVQLRGAGAAGLDQYETRLRNNAGSPDTLANLFCEGRAALMFLHNGWQVTLRESPDLQLGLHGDVVYAEVKRFCEKKQDRLNERAMSDAPDDGFLGRLDDPTQTEGKTAWEQLVDVAIKKAPVYMEGAANILVVESDSECLDLMVNSAVHEYDERALASGDLRLRRLNGIMLVNRGRTSGRPIPSNVEFCQAQHAAVPLNERLAVALGSIFTG